MVQTNNGIVHTLNPAENNYADTLEIILPFTWDNDFYKTSLVLGYYNFQDRESLTVRPFCIEKIVFHLTKNQMEELNSSKHLDLNVNTSLLWKMSTLGWGTCFNISSTNLKTFSALNYPEHAQLKRKKYKYVKIVKAQ